MWRNLNWLLLAGALAVGPLPDGIAHPLGAISTIQEGVIMVQGGPGGAGQQGGARGRRAPRGLGTGPRTPTKLRRPPTPSGRDPKSDGKHSAVGTTRNEGPSSGSSAAAQ